MTSRVWLVSGMKNGFVWKVLIRTTEEKLHKYMETELPTATSYTGATEKEVNAAHLLGMPIYCYKKTSRAGAAKPRQKEG